MGWHRTLRQFPFTRDGPDHRSGSRTRRKVPRYHSKHRSRCHRRHRLVLRPTLLRPQERTPRTDRRSHAPASTACYRTNTGSTSSTPTPSSSRSPSPRDTSSAGSAKALSSEAQHGCWPASLPCSANSSAAGNPATCAPTPHGSPLELPCCLYCRGLRHHRHLASIASISQSPGRGDSHGQPEHAHPHPHPRSPTRRRTPHRIAA